MSKVLALLLLAACGSSTPSTAVPAPVPGAASAPATPASPTIPAAPTTTVVSSTPVDPALAATGLDPSAIDRSADPCTDFYQYACGDWMKTTKIDADKPLAMRSFVDIEERNLAYLHGVLEQMSKAGDTDPLAAQLGAYYGACMNEPAIEKAGITPIQPLLAVIATVTDVKSLTAAVAQLHASGVGR